MTLLSKKNYFDIFGIDGCKFRDPEKISELYIDYAYNVFIYFDILGIPK